MNSVDQFTRTRQMLGIDAFERLKNAKVIVFGVGGVGSYTVEALARSGIGSITVVDNDEVALSNINRQLPATLKTIGRKKVDVIKEHILDINPDCQVEAIALFYNDDTKNQIDLTKYDYVCDAIDTVSAKLYIAQFCYENNIPCISAMGAGNKLDPTRFEVGDIYKTSVCPLARVMRRELKARGVKKLKVVYSKEEPAQLFDTGVVEETAKRQNPGSIAFVPSVMGLILAGEIIKDISKGTINQ